VTTARSLALVTTLGATAEDKQQDSKNKVLKNYFKAA
jgi:hypothetical protein